jgi:hypothetical protein
VTTAQIAIPAVFLAFSALFVLARVVRHRNAARPAGRHENGHTMHHDGPPPAAKRLPSASDRAAAFSELATPCPDCGGGHIGGCGMRPGPGSLPAHLRPGVVLPSTPKLALAPALEPLPGRPASLPNWRGEDVPGPDDTDPDLTITAGPGADEAYQDVVNAARTPDVGQGTDKSGTAQRATGSLSGSESAKAQTPPAAHPNRPDGQTTGEIFEHLCEGTGCWCHSFRRLPAAVVKELKHETVDEAVASIVLHAKEAAEFRAELDARLAEDEAAHADGQVASDA